jgi:hypothetical protein
VPSGGDHGKFRPAGSVSRYRAFGLHHPGCILLSSAAGARARIYAATIPGEHSAPEPGGVAATASAPNRLRYVAVPPGQQVEGMAHARIVVKHKKATRHRRRHAQKAIAAPAAAIKQQTGAAEPGTKP